MLCLIIMCNVAALTFYATIYEDICCICNKSREKHVLGTASTAGSLCLFDFWVLWLPAHVRGHNLQSPQFNQKWFNIFCTVCLCSIGTPKLL